MPKKTIECKVAEQNQEQRDHEKNRNKYQYRPENWEKVELLFGSICRIKDDTLLKQVLFRRTHNKNKRGRPKRRWTDRWTAVRKILATCTDGWQTEPSVASSWNMSWTPVVHWVKEKRNRPLCNC